MATEQKEEYSLQVYQQTNGEVVCIHDPKSLSNELSHILNRLMSDATIKHETTLKDANASKILKITIETVAVDIVIVPPIFITSQVPA